jgi:hypothetical protein
MSADGSLLINAWSPPLVMLADSFSTTAGDDALSRRA